MDSSPKHAASDPDPKVLAQIAGVTNPDATIRTPDGDVTIRTPGPVPADKTMGHVSNQKPGGPDVDGTLRMSHQRTTRMVVSAKAASSMLSRLAKPALAAASVALVLGVGFYVYSLQSKLAVEIKHRQEVEAAFQQQTVQAGALRQELAESRQELADLKQRTLPALQDTVAQREMDIEQLRSQLEQKEQELATLYKKASPKDEMLAMLQSATVRVLSLAGTDAARSAGGLILYDPVRGKAFLYAFNMPALQRGKVYQLWAYTTKPVSAGTFKADTGRKSRHLVRILPAKSAITKFAVSVEPEGGKPQPTGTIYLLGSL